MLELQLGSSLAMYPTGISREHCPITGVTRTKQSFTLHVLLSTKSRRQLGDTTPVSRQQDRLASRADYRFGVLEEWSQ